MTEQFDRIVNVVDALLAQPGTLVSEKIGPICSAELWEIRRGNPWFREFQGDSHDPVLCTVSLRAPRESPADGDGRSETSETLVIIRPAAGVRHGEFAEHGRLVGASRKVDPRVPPEGTVSYREVFGRRAVVWQFTARAGELRAIVVHENGAVGRPGGGPG